MNLKVSGFIFISLIMFNLFPSWIYSQTPNLRALRSDFLILPIDYYENTAKVIPPVSTFNSYQGEIVISTGQPRPGIILSKGFTLIRNTDSTYLKWLPAIENSVSYDALKEKSTDQIFTDNQLIRLNDGSLLTMKAGATYRDIPNKPVWWDFPNVQWIDANGSFGQRGCPNFFRSTDNGVTWFKVGDLDAATVFNGDFGWPRRYGNIYIGGDFDRFELYQCPFTKRIYISLWGASGLSNYDSLSSELQKKARKPLANTVIAYTDDMCKTWNVVSRFDGLPVPLVMTSTPDGRFCALFSWGNSVNVIFNSLKYPSVYYKQQEIASSKNEKLGADCLADMMAICPPPQISISRRISRFAGKSNVRVAYPVLNEFGRQYYVIKNLTLSDKLDWLDNNNYLSSPVVEIKSVNSIEPKDKKNKSLLYGAFVDPDYVDLKDDNNTSVFYWIESSADSLKRQYSAMYSIYYDEAKFTNPDYLSKHGEVPYTWGGKTKQGDYFSGGFFWGNHKVYQPNGQFYYSKDTLNYLCQWVEPDGIHGNIITVPPKKIKKKAQKKNSALIYGEIFGGTFTQTQDFTSSTDRYTTKISSYGKSTFGVNIGCRINDWIGFETGLQKFTSGQDMEVTQNSAVYANDKVNPLDFISVPLRYVPRFNISDKINILPSIGIKLLFNSADKNTSALLNSNNQSGSLNLNIENTFGSSPMLSFETGLSVEFNLFKQFSMLLKGNFNSLLGGNIKSNFSDTNNVKLGSLVNKLEGLSGLLGLRFYLPKF